MASDDGFLTEEQRELMRQASTESDLKSEAKTQLPSDRQGHAKHVRRSHSGKLVRVKKDGGGGKGTWGRLLDTDGTPQLDRNDPNYNSEEEPYQLLSSNVPSPFDSYRKSITNIIEEYFTSGDIATAASDLRDLNCRVYNSYFVKKLISMALDRHDLDKEKAAVLLSALYSDVISPEQIAAGFMKLLESADDLALDIPDAIEVLSLFVARGVVNDILAPVFLTNAKTALPERSKGLEAVLSADKIYLNAPHHAELIERKWGGSTCATVEMAKSKIATLLDEYIHSGEVHEALRCVRELALPFYHHEVVKQALVIAVEQNSTAESLVLNLLREASQEGVVSVSQMSKGFGRIFERLDDLSLDVPSARGIFRLIASRACKEGWLQLDEPLSNSDERWFKQEATSMICEYFLSGDASEVAQSLLDIDMPEYNPVFIRKLVTLALDRKNHEKEMASVLVSALYSEVFSAGDIIAGFLKLLEFEEDTALDVLDAKNELAMFIARAVVDEVLAPADLNKLEHMLAPESSAIQTVRSARVLVSAPHASERILRCWGCGGTTGFAIDDAKEKITRLLEEYKSGGVITEACRCIRELGMPFFHHEVVKKALVAAMEMKNGDMIMELLQECYNEGLITLNQMTKGFVRVAESLEDITLDNPDAHEKFTQFVDRARKGGWLFGVPGWASKGSVCNTNGIGGSH